MSTGSHFQIAYSNLFRKMAIFCILPEEYLVRPINSFSIYLEFILNFHIQNIFFMKNATQQAEWLKISSERNDYYICSGSENFNPYNFETYNDFIDRDYKNIFNCYINWIFHYINISYGEAMIAGKKDNERRSVLIKLLKQIPHCCTYKYEIIKKSNVLLISNEAGLTNCLNLYGHYFDKTVSKSIMGSAFHESMKSWLTISPMKVNGVDKINADVMRKKDSGSTRQKYGKIGYFLFPEDKPVIEKIIHLDLFPFAQASVSDINQNNKKEEILFRINEDKLKVKNKIYVADHLVDINFNTIKSFLTRDTDKFIFIIGNRVEIATDGGTGQFKIEKHKFFNKKYDNNNIVFDIISYALKNSTNTEIRVLGEWPTGGKEQPVYRVTSSSGGTINLDCIKKSSD